MFKSSQPKHIPSLPQQTRAPLFTPPVLYGFRANRAAVFLPTVINDWGQPDLAGVNLWPATGGWLSIQCIYKVLLIELPPSSQKQKHSNNSLTDLQFNISHTPILKLLNEWLIRLLGEFDRREWTALDCHLCNMFSSNVNIVHDDIVTQVKDIYKSWTLTSCRSHKTLILPCLSWKTLHFS